MRMHNKIQLLSVLNTHLVAYPTPMNLNYSWNGGSLAGMMLASQMLTGILLAMHYVGHVDYAFASVQHLMTDVPSGMILRYAHANGASLFFIVVYLHVLRGMYYGSGAQPREIVWISGVVILLVMIITAFIGYVLPWGFHNAQNDAFICYAIVNVPHRAFFVPKVPALKRIGPHTAEFCDIAVGLLLSDAHAERHGKGVRLTFSQSTSHRPFFEHTAKALQRLGYVHEKTYTPLPTTDSNGKVCEYLRLHTFVFGSLSWLRDLFYVDNIKVVKPELEPFLTPRALAYWIAGDGCWDNAGLRLSTHNFKHDECVMLTHMLSRRFGLECTVQKQKNGETIYYRIYVVAKSMPRLRSLVSCYLDPSMHYKINNKRVIV
uniref:C.smithii, mobile intron of apocytochrome b protein n=2 Tax=Chlamydomonas reinhardtii TaxID=3055 RepID=Q06824_CHLRE|nr:unnamed protein product [Chlamydomonas reinhardtii]